ncbi:MAG: hypothetical protein CSYNP_00642 [Syntrophus sp. SKADARSKE-3]|nr:hypothetical protein [Syntrophus sp. SKADARSKE-3]
MIRPLKTIEKLKSATPVRIAALGDSLTAGWMARKGYLDFLGEMLKEQFPGCICRIHASGIPGDTADFGLYRVDHDIINNQPDCIFIQYAINDASYGFTEEQFMGNIRGIINKIRSRCDADIVLVTSSFIGEGGENSFVEPYYQILEALGREYGIPVARVHAYWKEKIDEGVDFLSLVQYDLVHPTVTGYRLMAEAIMRLFGAEI